MSSTIIIREDAAWMPQSWITGWLLINLAEHLEHADPELAKYMLLGSRWRTVYAENGPDVDPWQIDFSFAFRDFSGLDARSFSELVAATFRVYDLNAREGPPFFEPPNSYSPFMRGISVFKALMRTDPRIEEGQDMVGTIFIREDAKWTAPAWIYDMVLEHLEADVRPVDTWLAEMLLSARTSKQNTECDLRLLTPEQFHWLVPMANVIAHSHKALGLRDADAPALSEMALPLVLSLNDWIMSDARTVARSSDEPMPLNWSRVR